MTYKQIESLKSALMLLVQKGFKFKNASSGVEGKVVGIGFKPFWTYPGDSRIDKIEFHIQDRFGRIIPFRFHYVIGYDVVSKDADRLDRCKHIAIDIHVFSPKRRGTEGEHYEKVRVDYYK